MANPRLISAKIIQKILEEKIFFGDLKKQIPEKDLPFCNMLILTALRRLTAIKEILRGFLQKKIPNKHRLAEYLLINAVTEILYMETAEYAVINETVKNVRNTCDKFLGGLANAVLRKVCLQKKDLLKKADQVSPLPDSFAEILAGYDAEQIRQIGAAALKVPALDITVKSAPSAWAEKLKAELLPNGSLRLYDAPKVQQLPEYASGNWWVQDIAAALPVAAIGDIAGKKVIDLCAAPGGKTAQLRAKGAIVTALDISAFRLATLQQNMRRLGYTDISAQNIDALDYLQTASAQFDAILLDAPCSATGTFRRHPEVLHIKTREDVAEQAALQKKLLEACPNILKVGGVLLYSVCSIAKAEGEQQIADFLQNNPHFKLVPISAAEIAPYGDFADNLINPDGTVRTLPYFQNGMDAFFICKLQRII